MSIIKATLIFAGTLSLAAGIIGIFIPGIPTTPFILLSAGLYIRSSDRLYKRLTESRMVGSYVTGYREKGGMTIRTKLTSIAVMWGMIAASCIFFIPSFAIKVTVVSVGVIGTIVMGFVVPTADNSGSEPE